MVAHIAILLLHGALLAPSPTTRLPSGPLRPTTTVTPRAQPVRCIEGDQLDVLVRRGEEGGLGVLVDQDNTVVTVTAQPSLQVGDVIVGVDGEPCNGRGVGKCLTPGAPEYQFSIVRPSASDAAGSLERVLMQLVREASDGSQGIVCLAEDEEQAGRAETLVGNLEAAAATAGAARPDAEALGNALRSGFWRLILVSEPVLARGGLTGYGLAPFCSVRGSFQAFIDLKGEQTAQVVEVVANANLCKTNLAALKGAWKDAEAAQWADDAAGLTAVVEKYERTEYGGSPEIDAPEVLNGWACTYLSDDLRVCRLRDAADGHGVWRVYQRMPADAAQAEIGRLMDAPVAPLPRDGPPASWDDRLGGGYERGRGPAYGGGGFGGGGGGGPEPMPERM